MEHEEIFYMYLHVITYPQKSHHAKGHSGNPVGYVEASMIYGTKQREREKLKSERSFQTHAVTE